MEVNASRLNRTLYCNHRAYVYEVKLNDDITLSLVIMKIIKSGVVAYYEFCAVIRHPVEYMMLLMPNKTVNIKKIHVIYTQTKKSNLAT
jgi:hypothetical protein